MAAPPPKADIDWANLSLAQNITVNGHIEIRHSRSTNTWSTPVLVSSPNIPINGLSPALNYGQQCYEGLKAFRVPLSPSSQQTKIHIFRPKFHSARLARSASSILLPCPDESLFLECLRLAVAQNAEYVPPHNTDSYLYIRPVLFGSSANLALSPGEETILAIYVQPIRPYHGSDALDGLVLDEFDRAAPRGMGQFKVGGNYAPVWRHAAKAKELGYGITLHLDSKNREFVEEFSTSGFLGHYYTQREKKDVLVVPVTESAIASATADSIIQLAELDRQNWMVERKELRFSQVGELDEVVAVGTAASAVPIRSITRLETNQKFVFERSENGRLRELAGRMADIQRGRATDTQDWCWVVEGYENTAVTVAGPGEEKTEYSGISGYIFGAIAARLGLWGSAKSV